MRMVAEEEVCWSVGMFYLNLVVEIKSYLQKTVICGHAIFMFAELRFVGRYTCFEFYR